LHVQLLDCLTYDRFKFKPHGRDCEPILTIDRLALQLG